MRPVIIALVAACILAAYRPECATATLGQPEESINADRRALNGQVRTFAPEQRQADRRAAPPYSSSRPAYTVERITTPSGVIVNEYVSPDGMVFAISWRGPRPPNLARLLGSYFSEYREAAGGSRSRRRGNLAVHADNLVVDTGGHMRDLRGRAYAPALVPPGLSPDEIQ
jgi:hypothetical protein